MALENDFLTFSCASGANVLTQAAYAAASATATGYVSGTAASAAVNKTLRQTSIMAAMIAQFIVDKAAQPVVDDGTTSTIETNFTAAILAVAETLNIPISQVTGLSSALANLLPITGNAASASKLATARNIALTGVVTGAVNFDGSGNVSLATSYSVTPVSRSGDTMTGALTIAPASGGSQAILNKPASGQGNGLIGQTAGSTRWVVVPGDNTAESGSNAGSNFAINRYSDAAAFIDQPFAINRATGAVVFNIGPATTGPFAQLTLSANVTGTVYGLISNANTAGYAGWFCGDPNAALFRAGSTASGYGGAGSLNIGTFNANAVAIVTSGAVRMTIGATGNIGIGGAPSAQLDVYGSFGRILFQSGGTTNNINSINVANSAYSALQFTASSYTFNGGTMTVNGAITATGGFQASDRRLKKNIRARAVQRGFALKIARMFCEWDRIADGVHDVGLVAQRLKRLASRYVIRNEASKMLAIDKAGVALEASMDNALHLHDHDKSIAALLKRIEKLEKAA